MRKVWVKGFQRERGWGKEEIGDGGIGHIRVEGGVGDISLRLALVTRVEQGQRSSGQA